MIFIIDNNRFYRLVVAALVTIQQHLWRGERGKQNSIKLLISFTFQFFLWCIQKEWVSLAHTQTQAQHKTYSNMLGHPNTASKCAQTSNRTVHSKRQTDRWITAQRNKTCHTKSALHTPHTPDTVHSVQQNGSFPLVIRCQRVHVCL